MFFRFKILNRLRREATLTDELFALCEWKHAKCYKAISWLEAKKYIVRECPDTPAEYYREAYCGAFSDYLKYRLSILIVIAGLIGSVFGALSFFGIEWVDIKDLFARK